MCVVYTDWMGNCKHHVVTVTVHVFGPWHDLYYFPIPHNYSAPFFNNSYNPPKQITAVTPVKYK